MHFVRLGGCAHRPNYLAPAQQSFCKIQLFPKVVLEVCTQGTVCFGVRVVSPGFQDLRQNLTFLRGNLDSR